ncbi:Cup9p [Sugiyamaella lignohabitans]|uniref:Cup9p n=1 Tax=Sugiyamaella lignohabitans TaxID=796027 RepID=A0A167EVB1_9ASCO|nr:Cup9p [Sugiyamaella lignohabitans]ANB14504.1 Cup9p [Sugiyamaella lignohabitans]
MNTSDQTNRSSLPRSSNSDSPLSVSNMSMSIAASSVQPQWQMSANDTPVLPHERSNIRLPSINELMASFSNEPQQSVPRANSSSYYSPAVNVKPEPHSPPFYTQSSQQQQQHPPAHSHIPLQSHLSQPEPRSEHASLPHPSHPYQPSQQPQQQQPPQLQQPHPHQQQQHGQQLPHGQQQLQPLQQSHTQYQQGPVSPSLASSSSSNMDSAPAYSTTSSGQPGSDGHSNTSIQMLLDASSSADSSQKKRSHSVSSASSVSSNSNRMPPTSGGAMNNNSTPGNTSNGSASSSSPPFSISPPPFSASPYSPPLKRRGNLPRAVTDILRNWLSSHLHYPYPTEQEKIELMKQTGLSLNQVSNWFINARRRRVPAIYKHSGLMNMTERPRRTVSEFNMRHSPQQQPMMNHQRSVSQIHHPQQPPQPQPQQQPPPPPMSQPTPPPPPPSMTNPLQQQAPTPAAPPPNHMHYSSQPHIPPQWKP